MWVVGGILSAFWALYILGRKTKKFRFHFLHLFCGIMLSCLFSKIICTFLHSQYFSNSCPFFIFIFIPPSSINIFHILCTCFDHSFLFVHTPLNSFSSSFSTYTFLVRIFHTLSSFLSHILLSSSLPYQTNKQSTTGITPNIPYPTYPRSNFLFFFSSFIHIHLAFINT